MNQQSLDVERILEENGRSIKKRAGDELILDCWLCRPQDTGGHLYFHRDTGQFYCQKCGEKGNLATLGWLPGRHGGHAESVVTQENKRRAAIFETATSFYQNHLPADMREYLHSRGLVDGTIERFRLGYAPGGLREHLQTQGFSPAEIKATGLVKDDGRDAFYRHLTIPYLERGRVVTLRARKRPDAPEGHIKYLTLKGDQSRLFNTDALKSSADSILLAEGEFDTIIVVQYGFAAVGIPGATGFKQEWSKLFPPNTPIAVVLDPDDAGQRGTKKIIEAIGPLVKVVELPDDLDLNQYFLSGKTSEDLRRLIEITPAWLDRQLELLSRKQLSEQVTGLRSLLPTLADLDGLEYSLYESKVKRCFKVSIPEIRAQVQATRAEREQQLVAAEPSTPEMNDRERDEALTLLRDRRLLTQFLEATEQIGCVGEADNKLMIALCLVSRLSEKPIGIIVKGESSSGKSYIVKTTARFFPPEEIIDVTALSAKALYNYEGSLSHKALLICERLGAEESDYPIRALLSEGKLTYMVSEQDPKSKSWRTETKQVEGPVAYIETTTRTRLNAENENRCFEIFPDESEEQTRRIQEYQRRQCDKPPADVEEICRPWVNAQRQLEPLPVYIPYSKHIEFSSDTVRTRRDFQRFLSLIVASALWHQKQREIRRDGSQRMIVADAKDYAIAYGLAQAVLSQTKTGLSPAAESVLDDVERYVIEKLSTLAGMDQSTVVFTVGEIHSFSGQDKRHLQRYLRVCESAGCLEFTEPPRRGCPMKLRFVQRASSPDTHLLAPEELERRWRETEECAGATEVRQERLSHLTPCESTS